MALQMFRISPPWAARVFSSALLGPIGFKVGRCQGKLYQIGRLLRLMQFYSFRPQIFVDGEKKVCFFRQHE